MNKHELPLLVSDFVNVRKREMNVWEMVKQEVQEAVNSYNRLGLEPLTNEEFAQLFNDTENLMFDKFTDGKPMLAGMEVDRKKAMELIKKPDGYVQMIKEIADVLEIGKAGKSDGQNRATISVAKIHGYFELHDGRNVAYAQKLDEKLNNIGKTFARTQQTADVYCFLQDVVKAYYENGLDKYESAALPTEGFTATPQRCFSGNIIPMLCTIIRGIDSETKTPKIKEHYFNHPAIHTGMKFELTDTEGRRI